MLVLLKMVVRVHGLLLLLHEGVMGGEVEVVLGRVSESCLGHVHIVRHVATGDESPVGSGVEEAPLAGDPHPLLLGAAVLEPNLDHSVLQARFFDELFPLGLVRLGVDFEGGLQDLVLFDLDGGPRAAFLAILGAAAVLFLISFIIFLDGCILFLLVGFVVF